MKTVMMILVALVLVACSACDDTSGKADPTPKRASATWTTNSYRLVLRFDRIEGFPFLVDEKIANVQATHGATHHFVECFTCPEDWVLDVHEPVSSYVPGIIIEGRLYGATVTGANLRADGFGVLPQNMDGSFVTDLNPEYPAMLDPEFFAAHPIAGQITARSVREIHYRTECRADGLLVTWDGVDHFFPKDPS